MDRLHVTPTAPGPIEKAAVGHLELHYSLLTLLRSGFNLNAPFLESVTLHDADVIYDPSKAPPPKPKKKEPFSLPPLPFPGRLSLRNVNFLLRAASKETAAAAGQAAAASPLVPVPASPVVAATTSAAVGQGLAHPEPQPRTRPDAERRAARGRTAYPRRTRPEGRFRPKTSYRNRDLQLTDLVLAPDIRFRLLGIDASKLEQQFLSVTIAAELFKGRLDAGVQIHGIGKPPTAGVKLDLTGLSLGSVHDFSRALRAARRAPWTRSPSASTARPTNPKAGMPAWTAISRASPPPARRSTPPTCASGCAAAWWKSNRPTPSRG